MPFMPSLPDPGTADIFISYSHQNRDFAVRLADAMTAHGLRVWWDRDLIAGTEFADVIEAQLDGARVVVTLWSAESVKSAYVRDESARALRADKLVPVRIEDVELPLGFGQTHTLDLIGWEGETDAPNLQHLLRELLRRKGEPLAPQETLDDRKVVNWRRRGMVAAGIALPLVAGYVGYRLWDENVRTADALEAERRFTAGLAQQHAREPDLVSAQNAYLSALELRPSHARARYYLGHVYAQRRLPADALASFQLALVSTDAPLDNSQRRDADGQIKALAAVPGEAAPLARSLALAPAPAAVPAPSPAAVVAAAASAAPAALPAPAPADPGGSPPVAMATPPEDPSVLTRGGTPRPAPSRPAATPPSRPSASPAHPPRGELPAAELARLSREVATIFGTDKEERISATTRLAVDPDALSDAVPLAVDTARALLARPRASLTTADTSGVVNTLVLLQSALPATLDLHRAAIAQLVDEARGLGPTTRVQADKVAALLQAAQAARPRAFVQIADEAQRPLALALAQRFRASGYDAPAVELVGARAPARTELRIQGRSERGYARWITRLLTEAIEAEPRVSTLRSARPQSDTYEIWFGRELCVPGGREVAACVAPR